MSIHVNTHPIAQNTLLMSGFPLLIMAASLYTSRVVLNTLGVEDYGFYNVVGGFVAMLVFLNGAMMTSTQRYLSFECCNSGERAFIQTKAVSLLEWFKH